jgi:cytochrome c biogenesis protein CcmG, thiol:disulfide interchange protein DsbE
MATRDAADANRAAASQRSSPGGGSRLPLILAVVVGLCAIVAVVVTLASSGDDEPDLAAGDSTATEPGPEGTAEDGPVEDRAQEVTVTGTALDAYVDGVEDLAEGKPMPALTGTDLEGETITIGPDDGPAIFLFVAHWCPHCQAEVPRVADWLANGGGEGVEVRAVSTAFAPERGNWPSSAWLAAEDWTVPTLLDPTGAASLAIGQGDFPFFMVVDAEGNIVTRVEGELSPEALDQLAAAATAEGT